MEIALTTEAAMGSYKRTRRRSFRKPPSRPPISRELLTLEQTVAAFERMHKRIGQFLRPLYTRGKIPSEHEFKRLADLHARLLRLFARRNLDRPYAARLHDLIIDQVEQWPKDTDYTFIFGLVDLLVTLNRYYGDGRYCGEIRAIVQRVRAHRISIPNGHMRMWLAHMKKP